MHSSRDRILEAAVRVYAEQGFRGATTRRIAEEAGVNEITVFRHFGSKDALITEALRACATQPSAVDLPEVPRDPQRELAAWSAAELADMREHRALIGRVISEMGEHPEIIACTSAGALSAEQRLCAYVERLRAHGLAPAAGPSGGLCDLDRAAVSMLMSALFADAMWRDTMPSSCALPTDRAVEMYVRIFLLAVGVQQAPRPARAVPAAARVTKHPTNPTK
jgi:AcrR family transcriptional regulator